jgi:transposase
VDAHGMPVRMLITDGTTADCTKASELIEGLTIEHLLADKAYDTDALILQCKVNQTKSVIPPKKNRIKKRDFDQHIYRHRHLVENAFLQLKRWRGISTRYAKNTSSFLAAVQIRCIALWAAIS